MLELQMGLNRDKRRERLMNQIKARCEAGEDRIFLLVPEQANFLMAREVCRVVGNDMANGRVEVVGFRQLIERVFAECGGGGQYMDDGGRLMTMTVAVNKTRKDLLMYKSSATRPEFLKDLLSTYTTMALHGIGPNALRNVTTEIESPVLQKKLHDLALIFDAYEQQCLSSKLDPAHTISAVTQILSKEDWLKGTKWYIDGFTDFPQQQMDLVQVIIGKADYVMVCLAAEGTGDTRASSQISVETAKQLNLFAAEADIENAATRTPSRSDEHPALAKLQNELCDTAPATVATETEDATGIVDIYEDPSVYLECLHVAGEILRSVREDRVGGMPPYRFRDISVVLCDYDRYAPVMDTVCRRYGIPMYFGSSKEEIGKKPVMLAVNAALDAATRGMPKEEVLQYLKSGLSNLDIDEVDLLESYVRTWNIHGRGWEPEDGKWILPPSGYGRDMSPEEEERLEEINKCREKGIQPLLELRNAMREGKTIASHAEALYAFLERVGFVEHLQEIVDALVETSENDSDADANLQMAVEYGQVSDVLNNAMEQMHSTIGGIEKTPNEFVKLFKLICGAYKISTIPVRIDQVEALSVEDARYVCSKVRFILGAEEGVFPTYNPPSALFDANDIQEMRSHDLNMPGSEEDLAKRGMSDIATVISGAKERLVLSYASDPASPTTPSHMVLRTAQMFPYIEPQSGADNSIGGIYAADLTNPEVVGKLIGRIYGRDVYQDVALTLTLLDNDQMQNTACRVMDKAAWALGDLSRESIKGLYGETLPLSATRTDTYASCRYHHFLRYGLKLREPIVGALNSPVFGQFAHFVLEKAIREVQEDRGGFDKVTTRELYDITRKHIEAYTAGKLRGLSTQPERYKYLYVRNCREILAIMDNVGEEFRNSDFRSVAYELKVGGEFADMPAIPVPGDMMSGAFIGIADRIDTCTLEDGRAFFRVVDYKTGRSKSFDFCDILAGKSLQLLLYQAALHAHGFAGADGKAADAAGVLYVPAKQVVVAMQSRPTDEEVAAEHDKEQRRRGMLLNDKEVLNAMEHIDGSKARFLPVKYNKDGSVSGDLCTAEQLAMLDKFVQKKLGDMVNDVASGKVKANPTSRGMERTSCTYCPYKAICHKDICGVKYRYQAKVSAEEMWARINAEIK